MLHLRLGSPWYHVVWRDHPGGNTWEPAKNLTGEDGLTIVRLYEEDRAKEAAEHQRLKVRVPYCYVYLPTPRTEIRI